MVKLDTDLGWLEAEVEPSGLTIEYGYSTKGRWRISDLDSGGESVTRLLQVCKKELEQYHFNWVHVYYTESLLDFNFVASGQGDVSHFARLTDTGRQQLIDLIEGAVNVKRIYFEADNLTPFIEWMKAKPDGLWQVLIGAGPEIEHPNQVSRLLVESLRKEGLVDVGEWLVERVGEKAIVFRIDRKRKLPIGLPL